MKKKLAYLLITLIIGMLIGAKWFSPSPTAVHTDHPPEEHQQWTCAMHPQIQKSTQGNCPICGMALTLMQQEASDSSQEQFTMTKTAMALANIQTSVVSAATPTTQRLQLSGTIRENEKTQSVVVSHFAGRIEKLYVKSIGETIRKGQLIAMLYAPELVTAQQELLTAAAIKQSQPALYNAVRKKLKIKKITEAQITAIETTGKIQEAFPIYAHFSGVVTAQMVKEGDHVSSGQALYHVSDLSTVWATFDVYEHQMVSVQKGQSIEVTASAYPNMNITATLSFVDPVVNPATQIATARAVVSNTTNRLKPGMFIEGELLQAIAKDTTQIHIPASAVLWTGKKSLVYVKVAAHPITFAYREVLLGTKQGAYYPILSGLQVGEEIVTHGAFTVDAAAQLAGKKSMIHSVAASTPVTNTIPIAFRKSFTASLSHYFLLKNALVSDDTQVATTQATHWLSALRQLEVTHADAVSQIPLHEVIIAVEALSKLQEINDQRAKFVTINQAMLPWIQTVYADSKALYIQHCPMANNDQGASWISQEKQIRNSYFGMQMLSCGSVVEVLQ